jgi:hypothetical protein
MRIKHKLEYIVMVAVSLFLVFALQQTIVVYGIQGEIPYTEEWRSSGEGYTSDALQQIQEIKQSIRDQQEYFFYVGEEKTKEYASIASITQAHPFEFRTANTGVVNYIEADEPLVVRYMVSSQSSKDSDKVYFVIESLVGDVVYGYEGINESIQQRVELEPGTYFISWWVVANESDFDVTMKYEIDQ